MTDRVTGTSVHNHRKERLWVDLYRSVAFLFYRLFHFLEQHSLLNPLNELHLFALHYVHMPKVKPSTQAFQEQRFVQGALQLRPLSLVALDFFQKVGEDYGISSDDPTASREVEAVTIPEGWYTLLTPTLINYKPLFTLSNPLWC